MLSCLSPLSSCPSPVLSYLIYSCLVLSCRVLSCLFLPGLVTSVMFWPGRVFFDSNNPFLSELCVICVHTFHSLCVNHVLPYITPPFYSHIPVSLSHYISKKIVRHKICVTNAIKWDVDPGYIFFHLKRKGIQAHREGICPSIHVANDKKCISSINNSITIAQKR